MISNRKIKTSVHRGILHVEKALLLFIVAGTIWAAGFDIVDMFSTQGKMDLADLFLLFIYAEILGMVARSIMTTESQLLCPLLLLLRRSLV